MTQAARSTVVTLAALVVILAATGPASVAAVTPAGASWGAPLTLATGSSVDLEDAAFRGGRVAVGWSSPGDGPGDILRVRRSGNGGGAFTAPTLVRRHTRQASFALCGDGTLVSAFGHYHSGLSAWMLDLRGVPGWSHRVITSAGDNPRWPDIVCPGPPQVAWVAWIEFDGHTDQVFLARATSTDPGLPAAINLGNVDFTQSGPMLVPTADGVFVAWASLNGDIVGRSAEAGGGGIALGPLVVIADGTPAVPATFPVIGSSGQRIVVAWERCDIRARVSTDGGTSWGPVRRLTDLGCDVADVGVLPRSVAVRGERIAIVYLIAGIGGGEERLVRSTNDLATRANVHLSNLMDEVVVGYTQVNGSPRLAVAYDRGTTIRYRRCATASCGGF